MALKGFGKSKMLQNTKRTHSNEFWYHLTLPNIKISTFYHLLAFSDFEKLGVVSNQLAPGVFCLWKNLYVCRKWLPFQVVSSNKPF
jgi:hypothetical protein